MFFVTMEAAPLFESAPVREEKDPIGDSSEEYSAYSDASNEYYQSRRGLKYNLRPRRLPMPSGKSPKKNLRKLPQRNISSTFPSPGTIYF